MRRPGAPRPLHASAIRRRNSMSSLFDLPFEDAEPDPGPAAEAGPEEQDPPSAAMADARRVLSVCEHLAPEGLGALQLAFDQLKARLAKEGLFDRARKRPLPSLPRKIGIVTSLDGAAVRDIIKVLRRRYPNAHLVIRPTRVQGDGAAIEVARGIAAIVKVPGIDVVIVGRGGGSMEDLWAFNEEAVARAIVASPVPVVSAIGHETDVTIADFVADLRAPTPSAAAELIVLDRKSVV